MKWDLGREMIIVAGFTRTRADKRDTAVAAFAELVAKARDQEGCMDFAISADPLDRSRINLFELWGDQDALEAWQSIARPPDIEAVDTSVDVYEVHEPARNPDVPTKVDIRAARSIGHFGLKPDLR